MIITIEALDLNNWLKICDLSVSEELDCSFTRLPGREG